MTDPRRSIGLDLKGGVLSFDVQHDSNLWQITLAGVHKTRRFKPDKEG